MSETTPGYYVAEYPDGREIITIARLNKEVLSLQADKMKQFLKQLFCSHNWDYWEVNCKNLEIIFKCSKCGKKKQY